MTSKLSRPLWSQIIKKKKNPSYYVSCNAVDRSYYESKNYKCSSLPLPSRSIKVFNNVHLKQAMGTDGFLTLVKMSHCCEKSLKTESTSSKEPKKENKPEKNMSIFQKFKSMYRDYWYVLVPVHLVTSAFWFGSFYYMARSGVDIAALAEMVHLNEDIVEKIRKNSNTLAGHLAVSYLLYKVITPVRYTVTVGGTTVSINYLKKWGYIKPIPKKEEFKKMLEEQTESFRFQKENLRTRRELMKKNVLEKLSQKKRMKRTEDYIKKILQNRRISKNG